MTLGRRIKAARERLEPKMTQQDLADRLGTSDKAVSGWERDKAVPEFAKMPELRRILRVTYAWLVEGNSAAPPAIDDPEVIIEDRAINLYRKERRNVA
jgi:transcriptional regulator with XRE-family HTH domain